MATNQGELMPDSDPFSILFGDLEKLGPSSRNITAAAIHSLPRSDYETIVDAGCGTGEQTLILVTELKHTVHAVDINQNFLNTLRQRAQAANVDSLVHTHCLNLEQIGEQFPEIDLLWSEGAAYSIGFDKALNQWSSLVTASGCAVVSELCWLSDNVPDPVRKYFDSGYPAMKSIAENCALIQNAGFSVLAHRILPTTSWMDGYYDVLEPKAQTLINHQHDEVRELAQDILEEIDIFRQADGCYSYVIFTLRPVDQ